MQRNSEIRLDILYIQQLIKKVNINQPSKKYGNPPLKLLAKSRFCNKEEQEQVLPLLVEEGAIQNLETKQIVLELAQATRDNHRNGFITLLQELQDKQKVY